MHFSCLICEHPFRTADWTGQIWRPNRATRTCCFEIRIPTFCWAMILSNLLMSFFFQNYAAKIAARWHGTLLIETWLVSLVFTNFWSMSDLGAVEVGTGWWLERNKSTRNLLQWCCRHPRAADSGGCEGKAFVGSCTGEGRLERYLLLIKDGWLESRSFHWEHLCRNLYKRN